MNDNEALQDASTIDELMTLDREQAAAWKVFTRQYGRERPEPKKPSRLIGLPLAMLPYGIVGIAAVVLSAMRTAPVFSYVAAQFGDVAGTDISRMANVEGMLATVVVDFAVVVFRFAVVVQNHKPNEDRKTSGWITSGFWVALAAQVFANLYGTMGIVQASNEVQGIANLVIMLVAGLSGVLIALAIGEILGHQWLTSQTTRQAARDAYNEVQEEWLETRKKTWDRRKKQLGVGPVNVRKSLQTFASESNSEQTLQTTAQSLKPSHLEVIKFVNENEAENWKQVDIAKASGLSTTTVSQAMKAYKAGYTLTSNGNGKH